ncbi:hypothetical protein E2I00_011869, partial [Balaenoptera physalus]
SPHEDVGGTIASLVCSVHIQPPRAGLAPREGEALAPPLPLPNPGSLSVRKTGCDLRAGAQGQGHTVLYFCLRREPLSLVNLRKRNLEPGEEELASRLDHYKAKATRHIFLIRHSQYHVDASLEKDRTLTPLGREQAELTGLRLASLGLKFNKIVHSSMTRAIETTDIISKHLPGECQAAPGRLLASARALQFPPEGWLRLSLNNGSITHLVVRPDGRVALRTLGDTGFMPPDKISRS